jgi:hypothetical protein
LMVNGLSNELYRRFAALKSTGVDYPEQTG